MSGLLRRSILSMLALVLALAGCSRDSRPTVADWRGDWDAMVGVIPPQEDLGSPPDAGLCQETLGAVREHSADLLPGPSVTVDDLVNEWIALAERAFFECPPEGQDMTSFQEAYAELERAEEAVNAALSG